MFIEHLQGVLCFTPGIQGETSSAYSHGTYNPTRGVSIWQTCAGMSAGGGLQLLLPSPCPTSPVLTETWLSWAQNPYHDCPVLWFLSSALQLEDSHKIHIWLLVEKKNSSLIKKSSSTATSISSPLSSLNVSNVESYCSHLTTMDWKANTLRGWEKWRDRKSPCLWGPVPTWDHPSFHLCKEGKPNRLGVGFFCVSWHFFLTHHRP